METKKLVIDGCAIVAKLLYELKELMLELMLEFKFEYICGSCVLGLTQVGLLETEVFFIMIAFTCDIYQVIVL